MPEDTTSQTSATPSGTPPVDPTTPSQSATPGPEAVNNPEALLAAHNAQKDKLKATTAELASTKATLQKLQDAQLTESERVVKERDTLKAEIEAERKDRQAIVNRYEVQLQATRLGIVDPDAAVKLLDWEALEYAEDGSPKNVEAALKALLKAKPYLAAQPGASVSPTNPARPGTATTETKIWTQAEIRQPGVWDANKAAITQAYREGRVQ